MAQPTAAFVLEAQALRQPRQPQLLLHAVFLDLLAEKNRGKKRTYKQAYEIAEKVVDRLSNNKVMLPSPLDAKYT